MFIISDLNPGSNDWDEQIKQYQKDDKFRIDVSEFASIYEQESKKKKATDKDIFEALKAVDPQNAEAGKLMIKSRNSFIPSSYTKLLLNSIASVHPQNKFLKPSFVDICSRILCKVCRICLIKFSISQKN